MADKSKRRVDALVEDKSIGGILRRRRKLISEGRIEEAAALMQRQRKGQSTDSNNR